VAARARVIARPATPRSAASIPTPR